MKKTRHSIAKMKQYTGYYVFLLPAFVFTALFKYYPMLGLQIAFKNYNIFKGIAGSPWVYLENFRRLFSSSGFLQVFLNTLIISFAKIIFLFPLGIFIALILNEVHFVRYKRLVQTVIYIPHFLSWVVVYGLVNSLMSYSGGLLNRLMELLGGNKVPFLVAPEWFRTIVVASAGWKECGWNAIVYLSAIAGIDQALYEAARMDGAGRLGQIRYVTLPSLMPTIILMFILRIGSILNAGTEQILIMYNPVVYDVGDVIGTYVYRMGIGKMEYSMSTAAGMFESVVGLILVLSCNAMSRKTIGSSIW